MNRRVNGNWDVLLADLALILFVTTLGGLVSMPAAKDDEETRKAEEIAIAPSQALYREVDGGPSLSEWLGVQSADPRATLTIFAEYKPQDATQMLENAARFIAQARTKEVTVRTVLREGDKNEIHASLAFDAIIEP